jgi:hypothetical protein
MSNTTARLKTLAGVLWGMTKFVTKLLVINFIWQVLFNALLP